MKVISESTQVTSNRLKASFTRVMDNLESHEI